MFTFNDLNNTHRTFVIAEAGSNWKCGAYDDDLKRAKELINIATKCGADAIKFQTFKADNLVSKTAQKAFYQKQI